MAGTPITTTAEKVEAVDPAQPEEPCRPTLGPDVQLVGEMPDVAFEDRQWLVSRDGRFIQMSEVLYRILEHADGRRTPAELAECVTDSTEWIVDEEIVRTLIETKLVPVGLIASAKPAIVQTARRSKTPSALAVTMRMKMLPQRWIDPLTNRLQLLFAPPLIVLALVAIVGAHWWVYALHGVGDSVSTVLNTPGALLAVFAIVIGAGLIHELGHASALRYGGGRARGIGVGLYLIFPAFFTDATDSYRLSRGARARTDLGGVYFHLLSALGLILLSSSSSFGTERSRDVFLFSAFLINLEVLRQFVPFVRLDGYWLLADLTGIPDFFSQMGPFIRTLLGRPSQSGVSLPRLRPAAKAVFAVYVLGVVPVLGYLFAQMVVHLPGLLTSTRDAVGAQLQMVSEGGSAVIWALAVTQMFFLAVPLLGTVIVLGMAAWGVGMTAASVLPSSTRRLAGGLIGVGAGAAFLLWMTTETSGGSTQNGPAVMSHVDSIVADTRAAVAGLKAVEADVEGRVGEDHFSGSLSLQRPNLARIDINGTEGLGTYLVVSTGREMFVYFPGENQYTRASVRPDGRNITAFVVDQVKHFFNPETIGAAAEGARLEYVGERRLAGEDGDVFATEARAATAKSVFYFVSRRDHLVHRVVRGTNVDDPTANWVQLTNVRPTDGLPDARFTWSVPPGATAVQAPFAIDFPGKAGR